MPVATRRTRTVSIWRRPGTSTSRSTRKTSTASSRGRGCVATPQWTTETEPTVNVFVFPDTGRVVARIPKSLFGEGDPAEWNYAVALMSQERFPSSGVRRIRYVDVSSERWRIGGGDGSINGTRIMDLLLPPEEGMQETMLSHIEMTPSGTVDDLTDDDFVQIMPIGNR